MGEASFPTLDVEDLFVFCSSSDFDIERGLLFSSMNEFLLLIFCVLPLRLDFISGKNHKIKILYVDQVCQISENFGRSILPPTHCEFIIFNILSVEHFNYDTLSAA